MPVGPIQSLAIPPYASVVSQPGSNFSAGNPPAFVRFPSFQSRGWISKHGIWAGVQLVMFGAVAMSPAGDFLSDHPPAILSAAAFADPKFLLIAWIASLLVGMSALGRNGNPEGPLSKIAAGELGVIASLLRGLAVGHEANHGILIRGLERISDPQQLVGVIHAIHKMRHDPHIGPVVFHVLRALNVHSILNSFLDSDIVLTRDLLFVLCFLSLHQNSSAEKVLSDERFFAKRHREIDRHTQFLLERARAGDGWAVYFLLILDRLIGWAMATDLVVSLVQMIREGNLQISGVIQNMDGCYITENQMQRLGLRS